ncbi:MAG: SDR family oxidoreductase [Paludibacteraceae bacterium]|nr:SDR family oxidoreductase [Paludibacteraceae bacterium]MBR4712910.1 SDR family oxidoreductase [Paludibacteraceae bacterium]MBR5373976.1 SDR family oxidoreductase [Paludibacteraceae bacterium]
MTKNPFSLEGKTILITGASSGIGQGCALMAAQMGAKVIVCGRNEERLKETISQMQGEGHSTFAGELTDQSVIEKLVAEIPSLNGVVFSAGISMTAPFTFSTREKFNKVFDVNFFSPIEILRLLVKKKKLANEASVVFISSVGGNFGFSVGNGIYGASKAALNSMSRLCSLELAPKKIRVNSICPGMVVTPLVEGFSENITQEDIQKDMDFYPLKRYGKPEDIAGGVVYLLSDAASWVTGQAICIDGGITAY